MQNEWSHRAIGTLTVSARQRSRPDATGRASYQIRYKAPDPVVRRRDGSPELTRREATVRAASLEAALDEAQRLQSEQTRHPITASSGQQLGDFLTEWVDFRQVQAEQRFADEERSGAVEKKGRPALRTVDGDREAVKRLAGCTFMRVPLALVDHDTMDAIEAELAARFSSQTIKNTWAVVSKALSQAVKWRRLAANPARQTQPPEVRRSRRKKHSTLEEVMKLYDACTDEPANLVLAAYVAVGFMTGARPSELLALTWADIDFARAEFDVTKVMTRRERRQHYIRPGGKTEESETYVVIPAFALAALKRLHSEYLALKQVYGMGWNAGQVVFWAPKNRNFGKHWTPTGLYHALELRADNAGLAFTGLYALRHGCATYLLEEGADIHTVKETLRHSSIALTSDTYAARTRKITSRSKAVFDRIGGGEVTSIERSRRK